MFKNRSPYRSASVKYYSNTIYNFNTKTKESDSSLSIATSHKWIATGYGGSGSAIVVPTDYAQYTPPKSTPPLISAHGSNLTELVFSPFHPDILATGAGDGIVKLWSIPKEGITTTLSTPTSAVEVGSEIFSMRFNPCADNIMAVGSKQGVVIIDLEKGEGNGAEAGNVQSVGWNYDGSLLAATSLDDKTVSIFDPRGDLSGAMSNGIQLNNIRKASYIYFLNNEGNGAGTFGVFSTTTTQKPKVTIFDSRNMKKSLGEVQIGSSSGYALPVYDYDTKLMYVVLRSSPRLSIYDFSTVKTAAQPQSQYIFESNAKGISLAPKSVCTLAQNEIGRLYTLTDKSVETYGARIPRKVVGFDSALFPDTIDTSQATMKSDEWLGGAIKTPNLSDIETLVSKMDELCGVEVKESTVDLDKHVPQSVLKKREEEKEKLKPVEDVSYQTTSKRSELEAKFHQSHFTHLSGTEPNQFKDYWFDFQKSAKVLLSKMIQVNEHYFAFPWGKTRGCIRVQPIKTKGRLKVKEPTLDSAGIVNAFDLSKLQPNLLATGCETGTAKVFTIPDGGLKKTIFEAKELNCDGRITVTKFHPQIENVLFTASSNFDSQAYNIQVWDLTDNSARVVIGDIHKDTIIDLSFDPHANLIATTCKDGVARIICPRTGVLVKSFRPKETLRETMSIWVSSALMLILGYTSSSTLSLSLWDIEAKPELLKSLSLGSGNFTPLPHFDRDISVLYLAKVGARRVQTIEVTTEEPFLKLLNTWTSPSGDFAGVAFQHKKFVNVKKVELGQAIKYMVVPKCQAIPISWTVPRKRMAFYQDDLYKGGTPDLISLSDANTWFEDDGNMEVKNIDFQPEGMTKLSEAPEEELTERQKRYKEQLRKVKEEKTKEKPKGATGHASSVEVQDHFQKISQNLPCRNKWDAVVDDADEVDEDEWDD